MTLWPVTSVEFSPQFFGSLRPAEILFEYEFPLTFIFKANGQQFLAHFANDDVQIARYIVSPTTPEIIENLKTGVLSLRSAIVQPIFWLVDVQPDFLPLRAWLTTEQELPTGAIPSPGVMLSPNLEPLLRLKYMGQSIRPGYVTADLMKRAVESTERAFALLADHLLNMGTWSLNAHRFFRELYKPTTQQVAFGSLEVAFRAPAFMASGGAQDADDEGWRPEQALGMLRYLMAAGFYWTAMNDPSASLGDLFQQEIEPNTEVAVLSAIKALAPTAQAGAFNVEVSGQLAPFGAGQRIVLNRDSRNTLNTKLRSLQSRAPISATGKIDEIDRGRRTFTLRWPSGEQRFRFSMRFYDAVEAAFVSRSELRAIGQARPHSTVADLRNILTIE